MFGSRRIVGPRVRGEQPLVSATTQEGDVLVGTRAALHAGPPGGTPTVTVGWERVQAAEWDAESGLLTVSEVGQWGADRPVHRWHPEDPDTLLRLVRERVTATVVVQRHRAVVGEAGVRVVVRRAPTGDRALSWFYEFDEGVDPADPRVAEVARGLLAEAKGLVGA
ncbi:hypothetical protein [Nocardioides bruguierae]|uniref:Uncharacterized protein n=1 Tax=Nocardioides bruguierae TaxID=2945102 RepID=A0A9X2IFX3_9ACTN|nr:hypothetical protein [Nocardioides bruguierae]MCM0622281.1 hypothetical protein [Nocardioides bruguierae]